MGGFDERGDAPSDCLEGRGDRTEVIDRPPSALARPSGRVVRLEVDDADQLLKVILVARKLDTVRLWTSAIEQTLASLAESGMYPIQWTVMSVFPRLRLFGSQISMPSKHLEISVCMQDR